MSLAVAQADGMSESEAIIESKERLMVLYDKILVRRVEAVMESKGGIAIPQAAAERPDEGIVVMIGNGRLTPSGTIIPLRVQVNDRVLFGKFSGSATEVETPGGMLTVLREDEILAIWRPEPVPPVH